MAEIWLYWIVSPVKCTLLLMALSNKWVLCLSHIILHGSSSVISRGKEVDMFLTLKAVNLHSEAWDLIAVILAAAIIDSKINQFFLKPRLFLNIWTI